MFLSSFNWQHQLCRNPIPNPYIKTLLLIDHTCSPPRKGLACLLRLCFLQQRLQIVHPVQFQYKHSFRFIFMFIDKIVIFCSWYCKFVQQLPPAPAAPRDNVVAPGGEYDTPSSSSQSPEEVADSLLPGPSNRSRYILASFFPHKV
jgi:hypothetical protein